METIKVNMSPNPLDVQTIHASQNDTEARQWEFELHNNGELIDTSDVKEQMVFKAYKGGTEQLLPENGSTPTTSPFKGDIRYPQRLLTDQEFTYRQSPTEEDGLAKITDIKGNTLVWNQLVQNGNFATTSGWTTSGRGTLTVSDNIATITPLRSGLIVAGPVISIKQGHKYLLSVEVKADSTSVWVGTQYNDVHARLYSNGTNQWQRMTTIVSNFANDSQSSPVFGDYRTSGWTASQIRNFMFIDLTQMGLDSITDPSDFTSLFSLPYYSYNQGSLLSFMGNGIKTVGKNLFDARTTYTNNGITFTNDNGVITINGTATANAYFTTDVNLRNGSYFISAFNDGTNTNVHLAIRNESGAYPLDMAMSTKNRVASLNNDVSRLLIYVNSGATLNNFVMKPMISFDSPEYFEPYTSSTLSLPISTYFPTGMKSAGSVYDELTPTKAITRIGAVDLGSLNWTYQSSSENMYADNVVSNRKNNLGFNAICSKYQQVNEDTITGVSSLVQDKSFAFQYTFNGRIIVRDTSYTDATVFKQAMADQNVKLYYELATPTETSFTTASLVTENAEIPLSNEDGTLIGKCTEELSAEPGFHDAKIKLSDADGECYSNKIQLHVERSPQ